MALTLLTGCGPGSSSATPASRSVAPMTATPSATQTSTADDLFTLVSVALPDGSVTNLAIEGRKILRIGPNVRAGVLRECRGLTVVPGFIDAHVHLGFYQPSRLLQGGLTTVRDLGWVPEVSYGWEKASAADFAWGPEVLAVGPMLTAKGGYPFQAGWAPPGTAAVGTPNLVDDLARRGNSWVKVTLQPGGPVLDLAELKALVNQAHKNGMRVTAHVSGLAELDKALECGVDELSHMVFDSSPIPDATIVRMVKAGTVVVPTLRVNPSPERLSNLGRFAKAGGRVVFGTDMGNGGGPGVDVEELRLMVKAGLPPEEVMHSATDGAAEWLGFSDRGRVEEGAAADLLLLRGDPRQDWSVLSEPVMVLRQGQVVLDSSAP